MVQDRPSPPFHFFGISSSVHSRFSTIRGVISHARAEMIFLVVMERVFGS
jgi:hypothetical protein